jgi:CO/xanthine dehydrogenase FAD-binding subunit
MKPPAFDVVQPTTVAECLDALGDEGGDDVKIIAGGQSLVPLLNFRLANPRLLVDVNRLTDVVDVALVPGHIEVGPITRQHALTMNPLVRDRLPVLAEAIRHIGHLQIRTRGTACGSVAHADPAAEIPLVLTLLGGNLVVRSAGRSRSIKPDDFFRGYWTTGLRADEMIVAIRFALPQTRFGWSFRELAPRHGDFASVIVAVTACPRAGTRDVRVAVGAATETPTRLAGIEAELSAAPRLRPGDELIRRLAGDAATRLTLRSEAADLVHVLEVMVADGVDEALAAAPMAAA